MIGSEEEGQISIIREMPSHVLRGIRGSEVIVEVLEVCWEFFKLRSGYLQLQWWRCH